MSVDGRLVNCTIDGFRFDRAVHLSFANEPEVREIFDRTPYLMHYFETNCHEDSRWLKHSV